MGETYSKAAKVIVWLGEGSAEERSSLAIEAIDKLGSQFDNMSLNDVNKMTLSLRPSIGGFGPAAYLIAIHKLLSRPWFTRLWVIRSLPESHTSVY